jgi:hypothetical protein
MKFSLILKAVKVNVSVDLNATLITRVDHTKYMHKIFIKFSRFLTQKIFSI